MYPFDTHKETNKFAAFLKMVFKDYPAFMWIQPSIRKILAFPFMILFFIFKSKTSSNQK
ncbi:MAG: hypothetical protein WCP92_00860 [bacterium]